MVKVTPEQQRTFIEKAPEVFKPCSGAWGRQGATNVYLPSAKTSIVRASLDAAAKNVASRAKRKVKSRTRLACLLIASSRLRTLFDFSTARSGLAQPKFVAAQCGNQHAASVRSPDSAATGRFGKTRCRKWVETGRDQWRRFEIGG